MCRIAWWRQIEIGGLAKLVSIPRPYRLLTLSTLCMQFSLFVEGEKCNRKLRRILIFLLSFLSQNVHGTNSHISSLTNSWYCNCGYAEVKALKECHDTKAKKQTFSSTWLTGSRHHRHHIDISANRFNFVEINRLVSDQADSTWRLLR